MDSSRTTGVNTRSDVPAGREGPAGSYPFAPGDGPRERRRFLERYNGLKLGWLHDSIWFLLAIVAVFLLFRFGIGIAAVSGDSMFPTLASGDLVLYIRPVREYRPGDIVSIRVPAGEYYIKRVVAVGGDVVDLRDGTVWVNGAALEDDWGIGATEEEPGAVIYPYTVRPGNVFVLGDNRSVSMDSRAFGEVSRRQIKGKILFEFSFGGLRRVEDAEG